MATAGIDDDNLSRRVINVNPQHHLSQLLEWAHWVEREPGLATGEIRVCGGGPGARQFTKVPAFVLTALLRRERARERSLAEDGDGAMVERERADAGFDAAMLLWARMEILSLEGQRDSRAQQVLDEVGWPDQVLNGRRAPAQDGTS